MVAEGDGVEMEWYHLPAQTRTNTLYCNVNDTLYEDLFPDYIAAVSKMVPDNIVFSGGESDADWDNIQLTRSDNFLTGCTVELEYEIS